MIKILLKGGYKPPIFLSQSTEWNSPRTRTFLILDNEKATAELCRQDGFGQPKVLQFDPLKLSRKTKGRGRPKFLTENQFPWLDLREVYRYDHLRFPELPLEFHIMRANLAVASAVLTLADCRPDIVLTISGTRLRHAALIAAARHAGIPWLYYEIGPFPNAFHLAREHGEQTYLAGRPQEHRKAVPADEFLKNYLRNAKSCHKQPQRMPPDALFKLRGEMKDKRVVFFAGQVDRDANMILQSPYFNSTKEVLVKLLADIAERSDLHVLFKPHPLEKKQNSSGIPDSSQLTIVRDINIKDAFSLADLVVTNNSNTGFEALLHDLPVVASANAYYNHLAWVEKYHPETGFLPAIEKALQRAEQTQNDAAEFAYSLLENRCYFPGDNQMKNADDLVEALRLNAEEQAGDLFPEEVIAKSRELTQFYVDNLQPSPIEAAARAVKSRLVRVIDLFR